VGDFEWDDRKAAANLKKHRVSFAEALTALSDPAAVTAPDLLDSTRSITIGASALSRVLFEVHTERLGTRRIRLISARKASAAQRKKYEEEIA
jgi:uncharacterized DUF497 family protein